MEIKNSRPIDNRSHRRKIISWIYLLLAILGGLLPTLANIEFIKIYGPGFDIYRFISMANINPASQSLSRDLLIGASAITIWMVSESRRLKMRHLWIIILTTFTIAFAFATPLFLYLRERRLIELESQGVSIDIAS